jgi:hypothetical protein
MGLVCILSDFPYRIMDGGTTVAAIPAAVCPIPSAAGSPLGPHRELSRVILRFQACLQLLVVHIAFPPLLMPIVGVLPLFLSLCMAILVDRPTKVDLRRAAFELQHKGVVLRSQANASAYRTPAVSAR